MTVSVRRSATSVTVSVRCCTSVRMSVSCSSLLVRVSMVIVFSSVGVAVAFVAVRVAVRAAAVVEDVDAHDVHDEPHYRNGLKFDCKRILEITNNSISFIFALVHLVQVYN